MVLEEKEDYFKREMVNALAQGNRENGVFQWLE